MTDLSALSNDDLMKALQQPEQSPLASMSDEDLMQAYQQSAPQAAPQSQAPDTAGLASIAGDTFRNMFPAATAAGESAVHFISNMVAGPVAGYGGAAVAKLAGNDAGADTARGVGDALTYQPRSAGGQAIVKLGEYLPGKWSATSDETGGIVTDKTGSPALGTGVKLLMEAAPTILLRGRGKVGSLLADERGNPPVRGNPRVPPAPENTARPAQGQRTPGLEPVPEAAPTKIKLREDANAAYKRAKESGVNIKGSSFDTFKKTVGDALTDDGIDPTLHPKATAALKRITDSNGDISLKQLETLRRIAKDAEGAPDAADARMGRKIVDVLDKYSDTIGNKDITAGDLAAGSAFKEARSLWSRMRKADELDELVRRAELSAPNFSGSGMENALRTEFRALAKNQDRMRIFTAEERAAIEKVAKGGKLENSLRMLGKFAPNGVVSTAGSIGAGFMAGGAPGAIALPVAGAAARYGATRMTVRNVNAANELVRRGPRNSLKPRTHKNALIEQEPQTP